MTWYKLSHDPLGLLWDALYTRGVRLLVYVVLCAALFPSSRFILLMAVLVTLGVMWRREHEKKKDKKIYLLGIVVAALIFGYVTARQNVVAVDTARIDYSPWGAGISKVEDGTYVGDGQGFRGLITVQVEVQDHKIVGLQTMEYPDLISVLDNEVAAYKREILDRGTLEQPTTPQLYRGAGETLTGYAQAIDSALTKGIPGYPQYGRFAGLFFQAFLGQAPNRVTLNGLAILFAVIIVFEYTLQSMLTPGTGRSINCYNCATCVGACPVKEAEGVAFPMGLVLLTRLGDYERVTELSKYCVGCGRCAAKCPIGNSGPMVISAAYQACRHMAEEKRLQEQRESA